MHTRIYRIGMVIAVLAIAASPTLSMSQGSQVNSAQCSLVGTWYGGGPTAKYLLSVTPNPGGDFSAVFDGAYSAETLGYPVMTFYSGSIVKGAGKNYEDFGIGMMNKATGFPAPTPEVWAVHSVVHQIDCNTLQFDYDFFGAYLWPTDKQPFLSDPDYVVVPPPFSETYRRMPTKCTKCG